MAVMDVELVEGEPAPARPRSRHPWRIALAVAAVLALALGGQAWLDARHRQHLARFDEVSGVLLPLSGTARERWTVDARDDGLRGAAGVHGHLVSGYVDDGRYTVRELDRATGVASWTTTGPAPESADDGAAACVPGGGDAVVCALGTSGPNVVPGSPVETRLLVLDAATGRQLDDRTASIRTWVAADGHVVTATSTTRDGDVTWSLESRATDGTAEWRTTLDPVPVRPPAPQADDAYTPQVPLWLSAAHDRVLFTDQGSLWVLDAGKVVVRRAVAAGTGVDLLSSGAVEIVRQSNETNADSSGVDATIVTLDGSEVEAAGWALRPDVDDGSADDTVLVQNQPDGLVALDARTGARRWTLPVTDVYSGVILDGTLYVSPSTHTGKDVQGPTVDAIDVRTGRTVWSHPIVAQGYPTTDGRAVYVVGPTPMPAFALDDGAVLPDVRIVEPSQPAGTDTDYNQLVAGSGVLFRATYDDQGRAATVSVLG